MTPTELIVAAAVAFPVLVGLAALAAWRLLRVEAQPDEWLLRVRNGRLVDAGVGIAVWRRPGDVVVRFTSTVQRVGFAVEAATREHLRVAVEGFVLWSVSARGDEPFVAYRRLGLANLLAPPPDLKHPKHLLTTAQYRAFQQLAVACVQRHAAAFSLDALLSDQDALVAGLEDRLRLVTADLGVRVDQVQVGSVRAVDPELQRALSSREDERLREEAAQVRLATAERVKQREIESATRLAAEDADARRDRAAHEAQANLELEQQRARLLEAQAAVRRAQAEQDLALAVRKADDAHQLAMRAVEAARERELSQEASALAVSQARREREAGELGARLERVRRRAEAARDALVLRTSAEAQRPQEVRDHEARLLATEKLADALRLAETRWVSVSSDSPLAGLAGLLAGLAGGGAAGGAKDARAA